MTEVEQQYFDEAPENEVVADNEMVDEAEIEESESQDDSAEEHSAESDDDDVEFPKKAVNALNRKNKKINKLQAQLRDLEAKLNSVSNQKVDHESVNPDDFDNYGDYIEAQLQASVNQKFMQSQSDMQKMQLEQQQSALQQERDRHIVEQANEAAQTFTDLPQVWKQNAQLLDALPKEVTDIFYSIDNAPAAVYTLAKEGKLESLLYASPAVAAYEIMNAQAKGLESLSKPKVRSSQAPTPISKARGTGSVKKQLSPNDDVLKSLGLK